MRILHIAHVLPGGVATYLTEIIPYQIAEHGLNNVRLLVPQDQADHVNMLPREVIRTFRSASRRPLPMAAFLRDARRCIRDFNPDVLHLHSTFAGAIVRANFLLARRRPRVVYCSHGWSFTMQIPERQKRIYAAVERLLARASDEIVAISDAECAEARARGIDPTKLRRIYNGIGAARPPVHDVPGFGQDNLNLLFVGRYDRQKGHDILLGAMRKLAGSPVHLHTVGAPVLSDETSDLPPNVTDHGWQPRSEVASFMAASDVVLIPSRWEGFGFVATEAMRMGKAVVATRVGGLPEIVEHEVTGLLIGPESEQSIVAAVRGLDRNTAAAMGEKGYARFLRHFTAEEMNASIADLYRRLPHASRRKSRTSPSVDAT